MSTLLINLVSDQTIPNIQLFKEFKDEVSKILFVSTDAMKKKRTLEWLTKVCLEIKNDISIGETIVEQHNFQQIQNVLQEQYNLLHGHFNKVVVNITCGTKIMSMAAFDFFKKLNKDNIYIYYLGEQSKMYLLSPNQNESVLHTELTVKEYLEAYGFNIVNKNGTEPYNNFDMTKRIFDNFKKLTTEYKDVLRIIQNHRKKKLTIDDSISKLLNFIKFTPADNSKLSDTENKYLSGGWFEEYVAEKIKYELKLNDDCILLNPTLEKDRALQNTNNHITLIGEDKFNTPKNEFDIIYRCNNNLHIIECKTSIIYETQENGKQKNLLTDIIYKVDSLSSQFGLRAQTTICTLTDFKKFIESNKSEKNNRLNAMSEQIARANLSRIKLIDGEMLYSENKITDLMKLN